jgi:predicted signal transduction protein with EAL and GGDEF domain
MIAVFEGDGFVLLIDGAPAPEVAAEGLFSVMHLFELDGAPTLLNSERQCGDRHGDRTNPGDLSRDADMVLYQAKEVAKNRYEVFQPEMQSEISRPAELGPYLRSVLEGDLFCLVYQPIYNLDDLTLVSV